MANEKFYGQGGTVTFNAESQAMVTSWSLTYTADTVETTNLADTWKEYTPGYKDWTATVECHADSGGHKIGTSSLLDKIGTEAALVLTDGNGTSHTLSNAFCSSANIVTDKDDIEKMTFTFLSAGDS